MTPTTDDELAELRAINVALPFADPIELIGPTIVLSLLCQNVYCQKPFEWPQLDPRDPAPSYHSKNCRPAKRLQRSRPCPRPDKIKQISPSEAQRACNEINARQPGANLRVYRCVCGWLHIGKYVDWAQRGPRI